eukprot:COSAG02_NODE_817_length_16825_cov_49.127646_11_plen_117_part_00
MPESVRSMNGFHAEYDHLALAQSEHEQSEHNLKYPINTMCRLSAQRTPSLLLQPMSDAIRMETMPTGQHADGVLLHWGSCLASHSCLGLLVSQGLKAYAALCLVFELWLFRSSCRT